MQEPRCRFTLLTSANAVFALGRDAQPISSTPKRKRRRHDYSHSDRIQRKQTKRSEWTIAGIKKLLLGQREMKAEKTALREEVRRLTASSSLPSAIEEPIVSAHWADMTDSEVFNRWNKDHHSDRQQLENAFKKGHDRYQRECHRASSSRQSQDPATSITDPTIDNEDQQP
ncbi:hypothetical protein SprV_0301350800 [Sparganum proliferum]